MEKILLKILNWLNRTPSYYGLVNNCDIYSKEFLDQSAEMEPEITLKKFMADMAKMNECLDGKCGNGFSVIEDGKVREGTTEDIEDLRNDFKREQIKNEYNDRRK